MNPIEKKEKLNQLNKAVKNLLNKFNKTQNNNKENEFAEENIGKEIVLIMEDGTEIKGKLSEIDKFRILLEVDEKTRYYFKHAVTGYYAE